MGTGKGTNKSISRYKNQYGFNPDRGYYTTAYSNNSSVETIRTICMEYLQNYVRFIFQDDSKNVRLVTGEDTKLPDGMEVDEWIKKITNKLIAAFGNLFDNYISDARRKDTIYKMSSKPIEEIIIFLLDNSNKMISNPGYVKVLSLLRGSWVANPDFKKVDIGKIYIDETTGQRYIIKGGRRINLKPKNESSLDDILTFGNFIKNL